MQNHADSKAAERTAKVTTFIDRRRETVVARGVFDNLFSAYLGHAKKLSILPGEGARPMMRDFLAAATLYLAVHPPDEFAAWTLNTGEPPQNFFCAGDNSGFRVTGRVYTRNVKSGDSNRLFHESQRPRFEPVRSTLDVGQAGVLDAFEMFFSRSVQTPSRLFDVEGLGHVLIQGLPNVDRQWLEALDTAAAERYAAGKLEPIEERRYRFACGCNPAKILDVVRAMYKSRADELFAGEDKVEVSCPRCGKRYWLTRDDFDSAPGSVGAA